MGASTSIRTGIAFRMHSNLASFGFGKRNRVWWAYTFANRSNATFKVSSCFAKQNRTIPDSFGVL